MQMMMRRLMIVRKKMVGLKRVALINYPTNLGPKHRRTRKMIMMMLMTKMIIMNMMKMIIIMKIMMIMMSEKRDGPQAS